MDLAASVLTAFPEIRPRASGERWIYSYPESAAGAVTAVDQQPDSTGRGQGAGGAVTLVADTHIPETRDDGRRLRLRPAMTSVRYLRAGGGETLERTLAAQHLDRLEQRQAHRASGHGHPYRRLGLAQLEA